MEGPSAGTRGMPTSQERARTVAWRLHREVVLLSGWGRAILLQLAHPLVAQGVADHSTFADTRWGRATRLRRTLGAMLALTFGAPEESAAVVRAINHIHDRVHGRLVAEAGPIPAGARYSAHDPALLEWVHATLVDTFLVTYERFVAPLAQEERDRYCVEAAAAAPGLGIPDDMVPATAGALADYMERMLASGDIVVTDTARGLAAVLQPLIAPARLPVAGMLPASIRAAYGFAWTRRHERALDCMAAASRLVLPALPSMLRYWPAARRAALRESARSI